MDVKTKFLHIMTHHNSTHNGSVINMINNNNLDFLPSEHLFIMVIKSSYEDFKHYDNVIIDEKIISNNMKRFNEFSKQYNYIFIHRNNLNILQLCYFINSS